jgi:hypothetical protein
VLGVGKLAPKGLLISLAKTDWSDECNIDTRDSVLVQHIN